MNQQRHVIKRQTVEITIDKNRDTWSLQQQISRMIPAQIIPLIDRYCGELSSANQIHRIEQLELDLGELDPDNFETDFTNKFADALRRGLAAQINRLESDALSQYSSSAIASHLELFSLFVQQGLLPWWADFQQPRLPEDSLDYLLREAPDALRRLLTELVRDSHALQRVVRHFDDLSLVALLELTLPTFSDFPVLLYQALMTVGDNMAQLSSVPSSRWREQLWQAMLQTAVLVNPTNRLSLFRETTTRWSAALGLSQADLLDNLLPVLLSKQSAIGKPLAVAITELPKQETSFDSEWLVLLTILKEHLSEPLQQSLLTRLEAARQSNDSTVILAELEAWLKTHNTDLLVVLQEHLSKQLQQSLITQLETAHQSNDSTVILAEFEAWLKTHNIDLLTSLKEYLSEPFQQSLLIRLEAARQSNDTAVILAEFEAWLKAHNTDLLVVLQEHLSKQFQQSLLTQLKVAQSNDTAVILTELEAWLTAIKSRISPFALSHELVEWSKHERLNLMAVEAWLKAHNTDLLAVLKEHLSEPLQQSLLNRLKADQSNDTAVILAEFESWLKTHNTDLLAILKEHLPEPLQPLLLTRLDAARQSDDSMAMLAELETWLRIHNTDLLAFIKEHLPEPLQQSLLTRLKTANDSAEILAELEAWISKHDTELPSAILLRLAVFEQLFYLEKNTTPEPALQTKQENKQKKSEPDELYIDNAGLVILWPFFNHFFENLGLVQEGSFLNDDSMQRAVALLQYLATENLTPPEYQLVLNKLLCGMELKAVFFLETPLTETEIDECNTFLDAVIEQAPILNKMSIAGFRGSFLLRQGILSSRDGASLLRVERETYDVVLDRFPWGMDWIKLPWMLTSLRVEW